MTPVLPATDAELDELRNGLRGVTPGPWVHDNNEGYGAESVWQDGSPDGTKMPGRKVAQACCDDGQSEVDIAYIALCSPDRIRALLARLDAAERELAAWEKAAAATDIVEYLRDALVRMGTVGPRGIREMVAQYAKLQERLDAAERLVKELRGVLTLIAQHSYLDVNSTDEESIEHWSGECLIHRQIARVALEASSQ